MNSTQTKKHRRGASRPGPKGLGSTCFGFALLAAAACHAQALTPDPAAWRPMTHADLAHPTATTATYFDIWKDAIDDNNRAFAAKGDTRFVNGNAPAVESHFVVWSSRRSVVLTVLNTATGCVDQQALSDGAVTVRLCPMRLAVYEGIQVQVMDAGRACFLESAPGRAANAATAATYTSYDIAARTLRVGAMVNHAVLQGCSFEIPIPPS